MTTPGSEPNFSDAELEAALSAADARSKELDRQMTEIQGQRESARREAQLLRELVNLRQGASASSSGSGEGASSASSPNRRPPHPAVVAAIAELERAGRPLHIGELMRLLEERDVEIPGSGKQANLIAHLTRNPQVTRPSRGIYALVSWDMRPPLKPASRKRVKSSRKQRSKEK